MILPIPGIRARLLGGEKTLLQAHLTVSFTGRAGTRSLRFRIRTRRAAAARLVEDIAEKISPNASAKPEKPAARGWPCSRADANRLLLDCNGGNRRHVCLASLRISYASFASLNSSSPWGYPDCEPMMLHGEAPKRFLDGLLVGVPVDTPAPRSSHGLPFLRPIP